MTAIKRLITFPIPNVAFGINCKRENMRIFALSAWALLVAAPATVHAQTRTDSAHSLDTVSVREKPGAEVKYAPRVNSSALKAPALLRDIPQSISIVTTQMMKDQAMQGMGDVVRYMPGLTIGQGEGNRDQAVFRGNASTADFYVDGVRDDVQYFRDIYNVDRVEALKGSNAMVFGRGGGGGVLNRVMKQAGALPVRDFSLEGGSFGHRRLTTDFSESVSPLFAARVSSVYQQSESFRRGAELERYGVTPTVTLGRGGEGSSLVLSYEHFQDHRTADRGIPSFAGAPVATTREAFFGDPDASRSDIRVNSMSATLTAHPLSRVTLTNRTRAANYDKYYRNVFAGAVSASGSQVTINAYDASADRTNVFNQTDVLVPFRAGNVRHTLLFGAELGTQQTANFRRTGYFSNGTSANYPAAVASPTISVPIEFRQAAGDADNDVKTTVASVYVQNQLDLSRHLQAVAGIRYERFDIDFDNHRENRLYSRRDGMVSPRAGLVIKPVEEVSVYSSYSVSYLPSSGDQFSSLTDVTRALEPEKFTNHEMGLKWDISRNLALSTAAYRLDRTNTRSNDPTNPARIVQTGSQRTSGYELDLRGSPTESWDVVAGFARQNAFILDATSAAPAGARVPLVPRSVASMWTRYALTRTLAVGGGVSRQSKSFATIDNKVTLPGFTKADAAVYYTFARSVRAQLNVENVFDEAYFPHANNNNNISVGAPRTFRLSVVAGF